MSESESGSESPVSDVQEEDEEMVEPNSSENESDGDEQEDTSENDETNSDTDNDDEDGQKNLGWANSMSRVLSQQPKTSKSVILSKAKKGITVNEKEKKPYDFEIDGEDIKEEKPVRKELIEAAIKSKLLEKRKARKDKLLGIRTKPSILDKDRERGFKKIATKGVVQLFNAIKQQQKDVTEKLKEAGPLDHRREKVLNSLNKRTFLDVLMKGDRAKSELIDNPVKDEDDIDVDKLKCKWDIFKDDFLTKKTKNWDKNEDSETEEQFNE